MSDVIIRKQGKVGRITLNRPHVLNAITHEMVQALAQALDTWEQDDGITLVMIEGAGARAFCAGGDIQTLYRTGRTKPEAGRCFWFDEYRLNARIHHYSKPYVAFMDGITMGGGAGISIHGSHRIVTERSVVAMPEVSIGFMPDVGSTRLLAEAPGHTGLYLGLCAARMSAADAIYAGFADIFVTSGRIDELKQEIIDAGDVTLIARFREEPTESALREHRAQIDDAFSCGTLIDVVTALESSGSAWEKNTIKALRSVSPMSAAATFTAVRKASTFSGLEPCLAQEYRFAWRSLEGQDFFEGIRAAIIDKDNRPKWQVAAIEDVPSGWVEQVLAPLGEHEWRAA